MAGLIKKTARKNNLSPESKRKTKNYYKKNTRDQSGKVLPQKPITNLQNKNQLKNPFLSCLKSQLAKSSISFLSKTGQKHLKLLKITESIK